MEKICPFCGKKTNALGKHLLHCKSIPDNLTKDEIKIKGLESYVYKGFIDDLCNDYENLMSFPDLRKKYGIDFKNIYLCLGYKGIKLRTMSESQCKITHNKIKETLQQKYGKGVINVGQLESTKQKVRETSIKKWGVSNIWKTKEYAEFTSKRWASYSKERKSELIHKWSHQEGRISKLENKIVSILNNLNIPIETQFKFPKYYHKYDILIKDTNLIIEVQGDYWHANPKKYKADDLLAFPGDKQLLAKEIWKTDLQKQHYAESQGFKVMQLWENDINGCENLEIFVIDNLNKYLNQTIF